MLDNRIKVLCFSNDGVVKGLKWAFDQKIFSERSYEFFTASLGKLPETLEDFDLFLMTLDLGQPVPLEILKKIPSKAALCGFLQPTPMQLLTLGELPNWNALAWDGVSFERLAARLDFLASKADDAARIASFVDTSRLWLDHHLTVPARIEWLNPPESWNSARVFYLDTAQKTFSIGGPKSHSDLKLPLADAGELCEFRCHEGIWSLRVFDKTAKISFSGEMQGIRPGDQLVIQDFSVQVQMAREIESFMGIAKKSGVIKSQVLSRAVRSELTLAEVCREFLASWNTGELRVSSGLRHGSVFFQDGTIQHAVAGAVSGTKALLRMLGWADPQWRFNGDVKSELTFKNLEIGFGEFTHLYAEWKEKWTKYQARMPQTQVKLRASARAFNAKTQWSPHEYQVFAAVCEFSLVRDIFNNCSMMDTDILASLVEMRLQKLIEPVASSQPNAS